MRRNLPLLSALLLAAAMVVGQFLPAGQAGAALNPLADPPSRAAAAAARLASVLHPLRPGEKPPQFVIFSFDGAGSHTHWQRIMDVAARSEASVTGFLSGIYLLDDGQKGRYRGPGHPAGKASIGFGGPPSQVATLVDDLNEALASGHEIGTHYNGHFCRGAEPSVGGWSTAAWDGELDQFRSFVASARAERGLQLDPATVRGGRTPCLEGNPAALFPALRAHGMTYDSSLTSTGVAWPEDRDGIREFPMPVVLVPALGRKVILMDYNLWYAFNQAREAPARVTEFTDRSLEAYRAAYAAAFAQNRAPLVVGNHFNDWNGGAFATAVERFLGDVCLQPETVCTTYGNVSRWMDLQDPAVLAEWRAKPHAQVPASFG
jgi:hypothetical protein